MTTNREPTVLIVDDDPQILEVYTEFLTDTYDVIPAQSGNEALEILSDDIDVVLLDRRMPGMAGDDVLDAISDENYTCRVAIVSALDPDFDIVDMGFDDYLIKPVTRSKLRNVVDSLLRWNEYDEVLREYFEVAKKITLLEEEHPASYLEANPEYRRLLDRQSALKEDANDALERTDSEVIESVLAAAVTDGAPDDSNNTIKFRS